MYIYYCCVEPITGLFYYSTKSGVFRVGETLYVHRLLDPANEHVICKMSTCSFLSELDPIRLAHLIRKWNLSKKIN